MSCMAHPKRKDFVVELRKQLPDIEVAWDRHDDRWETGRRALLAFDPGADYHVTIQDDSIPCSDFLAGVELITRYVPDAPISLYTGKTRPYGQQVQQAVRKAAARKLKWIALDALFWGVGVVLPVPLLKEMIGWHDLANVKIQNYDSKMSFYFQREGIRTFYTQPSLIDHRDLADGNPSLVPGRFAKGRVAHNFIGDQSPLEVNWDTKVLYLTRKGRQTVCARDSLPQATNTGTFIEQGANA